MPLCDRFNSLNFYKNGELSRHQIGGSGIQVKKENEKFTIVRSRSPQNLKCGHFTLLFCGGRQKKCTKVHNASAERLLLLLKPIVLERCRCRRRCLKPATHLAILYADRGEFDRKRFSPTIGVDTLGDFFADYGSFKNSCDIIAQPDGLTLLAIRSNDRRKSRERAHLANAGEFNCQYLTCQISPILYADRGDRPKIAIAAPGTPGDFRRSR